MDLVARRSVLLLVAGSMTACTYRSEPEPRSEPSVPLTPAPPAPEPGGPTLAPGQVRLRPTSAVLAIPKPWRRLSRETVERAATVPGVDTLVVDFAEGTLKVVAVVELGATLSVATVHVREGTVRDVELIQELAVQPFGTVSRRVEQGPEETGLPASRVISDLEPTVAGVVPSVADTFRFPVGPRVITVATSYPQDQRDDVQPLVARLAAGIDLRR